MKNKAIEIIDLMEITWWREENQETFVDAAQKLLGKGLDEMVIATLLNDLFYAVSNEYGD